MKASRPADEDRLPWLEPYRETKKPGKPLPRRGYGKPLAVGVGAALLIAVGAGGFWLGQQGEPTRPGLSETVALPSPEPPPIAVPQAPPAAPETNVQVAEAEPAKVTKPAPARKRTAARKRWRPKKIRTAGIENEQLNAVRAAQEQKPAQEPSSAPAPVPEQKPVQPQQPVQQQRPASRAWPRMPSPGPAGQVIQLGAFTTPYRASNAYRTRVARYPALARMPRVIIPVATKPGNRVLYVLRLGTTSRQQSKTVCRNLRRSGDHCLVIG